jgi:hypothetical protein
MTNRAALGAVGPHYQRRRRPEVPPRRTLAATGVVICVTKIDAGTVCRGVR